MIQKSWEADASSIRENKIIHDQVLSPLLRGYVWFERVIGILTCMGFAIEISVWSVASKKTIFFIDYE